MIRLAYAFYQKIRLEIITTGNHIQIAEPAARRSGFATTSPSDGPASVWLKLAEGEITCVSG
jgi:hypothetical protein